MYFSRPAFLKRILRMDTGSRALSTINSQLISILYSPDFLSLAAAERSRRSLIEINPSLANAVIFSFTLVREVCQGRDRILKIQLFLDSSISILPRSLITPRPVEQIFSNSPLSTMSHPFGMSGTMQMFFASGFLMSCFVTLMISAML